MYFLFYYNLLYIFLMWLVQTVKKFNCKKKSLFQFSLSLNGSSSFNIKINKKANLLFFSRSSKFLRNELMRRIRIHIKIKWMCKLYFYFLFFRYVSVSDEMDFSEKVSAIERFSLEPRYTLLILCGLTSFIGLNLPQGTKH